MQDDVKMDPKPQPIGDDTPPESGVEAPPAPPEAGTIDRPPTTPEPEPQPKA
jgi:hypothetical protein